MLNLSAIFATFPVLETARCVLRPMTIDDTEDLFHFMSDSRVTRYLARAPMASQAEALARIEDYHKTFQRQEGIPWGISHRASGKLIGTCVFWHLVPEHDRAEVGYSLSPDYWGQGLATEVVSAELSYGFMQMGLHSVEAQIDPNNQASRRVLEKLGFAQEGYFHENYYDPIKEQYSDTPVFSLLKGEWMSRTAKEPGN
ncbi:MAG TPA: GNAT family N-acetyltransferase [Aggregatilineales bacterium]|nr:GNAT family N-acetyltransferase [Aggregatilineales bacterium]